MSNICKLLELPSEVRLRIYEYIYDAKYDTAHNGKCSPLLVLRDDSSILQPLHRWFTHVGAGLPKTCRALHAEAAPAMYAHARFRIQMYIGDGWPKYEYAGPVDASNPLLRQMQHVEITIHLVDEAHLDPAFRRLRLLAQALEGGGANLKTLRVVFKAVTSYQMAVTRDLVAQRRDSVLLRLEQQRRMGLGCSELYQRMMMEGEIVSVN